MDRIPLGLFFAYTLKMLITGPSAIDAQLLFVLGAVAAAFEYKKDKRVEKLQEDFKAVLVRLEKSEGDVGELRTYISTSKMSQVYGRK